MRWIKPKIGTIRAITKFLWFPCKIDEETRWLERATIIQRYCDWWGTDKYKWVNERFLDSKENLKNEDNKSEC